MSNEVCEAVIRTSYCHEYARKSVRDVIDHLSYGNYMTCYKALDSFAVSDNPGFDQIEYGSKWLVAPDKSAEAIASRIYNDRVYRLYYTDRKIHPSFLLKDGFFENGYINITGKILKAHFLPGWLSKRKIEKELKMFRVYVDHRGVMQDPYRAYDRNDKLIASAQTIDFLFRDVRRFGYRYIRLVDENGDISVVDIQNED